MPATELGSVWRRDWTGSLLMIAIVMTGIAILCWRTVETPAVAFGIFGGWLALELLLARRSPRIPGGSISHTYRSDSFD